MTLKKQCRIESHESDMDNDVSPCLCGTNDSYATPYESVQKGEEYGWVDDYRTALSVQPVTVNLSIIA